MTLLKESLVLCQELGDKVDLAFTLEALAALAQAEGQSGRAARLFGAAAALRAAISAPLPPSDREEYDRHVAATRAALDETVFAAAWAEGRGMMVEEAIAYTLET